MSASPHARMEAFCDGVFAIALTLLVIDLKSPATTNLHASHDLWLALAKLLPSVFAFLLSFGIVFITWVNHHEALKLVDKSSTAFIYANGFLLLSVVIIPFPTALLGDNLLTDHAAPAVVLYSANYAMQAVGWWLITRAALRPRPLARNAHGVAKTRESHRHSSFAFGFYTACAIGAAWFPLTIAVVITLSWIVWLIYGLRLKQE